jgi:hypothetical protein
MNTSTTNRKVSARFTPETRFELAPRFESLAGDLTRYTFEQLKARLLRPVLHDAPSQTVRRQLRLAANEAAAVAWTTEYPLLVLPVLLEEKAQEVHHYALRQEQVQQTTPVFGANAS